MTLEKLLSVCVVDNIEGHLTIWVDSEELVYESRPTNEEKLFFEIGKWLNKKVRGFYPTYDRGLEIHIDSK